MGLDAYIEEYGLQQEKNLKASTSDLSKFEVSMNKGMLLLNKAIVSTIGLEKLPFVEIYSGVQHGATIFALEARKESDTGIKVKVLKTKPTKINMGKLLLKYNLSTSKDYKIDLIDCDKGYLIFAVLTPVEEKKELDVAPAPRPEPRYPASGIQGAQESVLPGSDF